jgi:integrase/recombinase XerD
MIENNEGSGFNQSYKTSHDASYLSESVEISSKLPIETIFPIPGQVSVETQKKDPSQTIQNPASRFEIDRSFSNLSASRIQDLQFLESWVSGKSKHTKRGYLRIGQELLTELHPKTLRDATLQTLQLFLDLKTYRKEGTKSQRAAILKSLFTFAAKTGYLQANVAAFLPKVKMNSNLTERYLSEEEVMRMIHLTREKRDLAILKTLYSGGLRVSELVGLNWEDLQPREEGTGQITILGKGYKKRVVVFSAGTFQDLLAIKLPDARAFDPVFLSSREGLNRLSVRMVQVVVDKARLRAGIVKKVSPHWLRHAHASHALDRTAPIHLVQATLGHASVATTGKYLHARPQESSSRYLGV